MGISASETMEKSINGGSLEIVPFQGMCEDAGIAAKNVKRVPLLRSFLLYSFLFDVYEHEVKNVIKKLG